MTPLAFLPVLGLVALTYIASGVSLRIHPAWAARTLALLSLATLGSLAVLAVTITATFFTQRVPDDIVHSNLVLSLIAGHDSVNLVLGLGALCLVVLASIRLTLAGRRARRYRTSLPRSGVVAAAEPFAVAVPGRSGRIVISTALREILTRKELAVVYQHEQAHLDRKHHIYMGIAHALATIFPVLERVEPAMRLAVERWADEEAAAATGSRRLVAETISKVALSRSGVASSNVLGAADHEVSRRAQALLCFDSPGHHLRGSAVFGSSGLVASSLASSTLQFHHIVTVVPI